MCACVTTCVKSKELCLIVQQCCVLSAVCACDNGSVKELRVCAKVVPDEVVCDKVE